MKIPSFLAGASLLWLATGAQAQSSNPAINGLNASAGKVAAFRQQVSQSSFGSDFLATQVGRVIGVALSFVGVLFFILIIYAGITWMTASGNEQKIAKAKEMLINSTIGLIIVFASYALVSFLGEQILMRP